MKNTIYMLALFVVGTAFAQEKPSEVEEKVETKTIKVNDGEKITEKKVKVVTRETNSVELDKKDENEVNQNRVNSISKVEKMVMIDDDEDGDFDFLTKETSYKIGDKSYLFKPNDRGFNIAFNNNESKFVTIENAFNTNKKGNYYINSAAYNGIGYFDNSGNFVIEYYDKDSDSLKSKTYLLAKASE